MAPSSADTGGIPEAAISRLRGGCATSGLSPADLLACLDMGMEPVGLVQGLSAMKWGWYGGMGSGMTPGAILYPHRIPPGQYGEEWRCPHGFVSNEHRVWGQNYQQAQVEDAWQAGFDAAHNRMVQQAQALGAQGIIGVVDRTRSMDGFDGTEFHLTGTAVVIPGANPPGGQSPIWSTYLAGRRLSKLIESGLMPVSIVSTVSSVRIYAYCMTELALAGNPVGYPNTTGPHDIPQMSAAYMAARRICRKKALAAVAKDALAGARATIGIRHLGSGDEVVTSTLSGTRARRYGDFAPTDLPRPMVDLT